MARTERASWPLGARAHACMLIAAALVCLGWGAAQAKSAGIEGTVTTAFGKPVCSARIEARQSRRVFTAASDCSGRFSLMLPSGIYALHITAPGYSALRETVNAPATIQAVLQPANASSMLVITSVVSSAAASSASAPSRVIERSQLEGADGGRLSDVLFAQAALTPVRSAGAAANSPAFAALRGPDPAETLVDIDGHRINAAVSGGFDLSRIDPLALQDVELVYGVAPSSLVGADTIGGAINVRTLEPAAQPVSTLRAGYGSFGGTVFSAQTAAVRDGIGYAVALDRFGSVGDVNANGTGSASASTGTLIKLRTFLAGGRGFVQGEIFDQTSDKDISAALSSIDGDGTFTSFAGSWARAHAVLYAFDAVLPGGITFRHSDELDSQSVTGPAQNVSQLFFNYRDTADDNSLQYDGAIGRGTITARVDARSETLLAPYTLGGVVDESTARRAMSGALAVPSSFTLSDMERSYALRYLFDPTTHLHYSAALYDSFYSTFGHSTDPRFGFVWTPTARTAVRFSLGTTFQSPLLTQLYVPHPLPPPDANGTGGLVGIGNPNLQPDRATEYDAGATQIITTHGADSVRLSADLYQTHLRNGIAQFVPSSRPGYTYPVNAGNVTYRGLEAEGEWTFAKRNHLAVEYVVNSAFLSGGRQLFAAPLHRESIAFSRDAAATGFSFGARLLYEGSGNELNRPPFATLDAHVSRTLNNLIVTLSGTNLTNVYGQAFTLAGQGVPYAGPNGTIATDAYVLPSRTIFLSLTDRLR